MVTTGTLLSSKNGAVAPSSAKSLRSKVGTVPVDAIPVRPLTTAQLEALDPQANQVVRLGHSSHLLKLRGSFG